VGVCAGDMADQFNFSPSRLPRLSSTIAATMASQVATPLASPIVMQFATRRAVAAVAFFPRRSMISLAARWILGSEIKCRPMPHAQVRQGSELYCPPTRRVACGDLVHAAIAQSNARDAIARPRGTDSVSADCRPWSLHQHRPRIRCAETLGRENFGPENNSDTPS
jgi:hypothetical protein